MLIVRHLQEQIVRAIMRNEMKLAYDIQRKPVTSFEGTALDVRQVCTSSRYTGEGKPIKGIRYKTYISRFADDIGEPV